MFNLNLQTERLILKSFNKYSFSLTKIAKSMPFTKTNNYLKWFGDEEITKYNSHGLFPQSQKELDTYYDRCENDKSLLVFMIIEKKTNNHIGNCSLQRIDWINRSAEFAIIIGEKNCWNKGYASEACDKLFEHGFLKLGLNRIWSGTSILNKGMIKVFEKLGMRKEGTYKQGQFLNGEFHDVVIYAILKKQWELLKWKQGK